MEKAVAFAHNDVAFVAWGYDAPIPDCLGFAVYRRPAGGELEALPAWVGWQGGQNPDWKPSSTEVWPVQKFSWRDLTAGTGGTYTYEIVPRVGKPGHLKSVEAKRLVTNEVHLTPTRSPHIRTYFNRGILSTQALARKLPKKKDGTPSGESLVTHIKKVGDSIRKDLAGQLVEGVASLLQRAKQEGGRCYCALYELNDPELIKLLDDREHVSLILSNAGSGTDPDKTNRPARDRLRKNHVEITDRMLKGGHIGHNKFVVYVDPGGKAQSVLTGSTNWTYTGLCAQTNNSIVLDDPDLAATYLEYWNRIKAESPVGGDATQSPGYRHTNDEGHSFTVDGSTVRLWASPNTARSTKPSKNPKADDMAEVFNLIGKANEGIFFLLFQPGSPSVLNAILDRQVAKPELFVRGAATDPNAIDEFSTDLFHRASQRDHVAAASGITDWFAYWQAELLKTPGAHAIIHDKVVVIDPLSPDCVVITGSHNLGYRASYANDDNLLIVKGHRALAEAYAVHAMDVYDHYRWRWLLQKYCGRKAYAGLERKPTWQDKYFTWPAVKAEVAFWLRPELP